MEVASSRQRQPNLLSLQISRSEDHGKEKINPNCQKVAEFVSSNFRFTSSFLLDLTSDVCGFLDRWRLNLVTKKLFPIPSDPTMEA